MSQTTIGETKRTPEFSVADLVLRGAGHIFARTGLPLRVVIRPNYSTIQVDLERRLVARAGIKEGDRAVPVIDEERKILRLRIGSRGPKLRFTRVGNVSHTATIATRYVELLAGWKDCPSYYEAVIEENEGAKYILFDYGDLLGSTNQEPELVPQTPTDLIESPGLPGEAVGSTLAEHDDPSGNSDPEESTGELPTNTPRVGEGGQQCAETTIQQGQEGHASVNIDV